MSKNKDSSTTFIKEIQILGNKKTSLKIVNYYLQLDTGMVFDSTLIAQAKTRLKSTDLFLKVDIISLLKNDGAHLYVVLIEGVYFTINDIGGNYFLRKYGKSEFWWRIHLGIENRNFRGQMEVLRTQISFWDWRGFNVSWLKPLLPSPYYTYIGFGIDQYPEENRKVDNICVYNRMMLGRVISPHVRSGIYVNPFYQRIEKTDPLGFKTHLNLYEIFSGVNNSIDFRNDNFDTRSGFFLSSDLRTNALYPDKVASFTQLSNDLRFYIPSFIQDHRIASRLVVYLRDRNTRDVHQLQFGGEGSIRGFLRGDLPLRYYVKDAFLLSTEYRFKIYNFPPMRVPLLSNYNSTFSALEYRLDGAIFIDYGRMSPKFRELFKLNSNYIESGTGIGVGLRIMVPTLEKSASIDLAWGEDPRTGRSKVRFFKQPILHLYIDLLH